MVIPFGVVPYHSRTLLSATVILVLLISSISIPVYFPFLLPRPSPLYEHEYLAGLLTPTTTLAKIPPHSRAPTAHPPPPRPLRNPSATTRPPTNQPANQSSRASLSVAIHNPPNTPPIHPSTVVRHHDVNRLRRPLPSEIRPIDALMAP